MTTRVFNAAGITVNNNEAKVRFSLSLDRRIKRYVKLKSERVDIVSLPSPMTKLEALDYLAGLPEFSSAADQATIADEREYQTKAARRASPDYVPGKRGRPAKAKTEVKVKPVKARKSVKSVKVKAEKPSIEALRTRARASKSQTSVSDILAAVQPAVEQTNTEVVA